MEGKVVYLEKSQYEILDANEVFAVNTVKKCFLQGGANVHLAKILYQMFAGFSNPFVIALKLSYCSGDFHSCRNKSLAVYIITLFADWLKENKIQPLMDSQIKIDALRLVLEQRNNTFRDLIIKVFNMTSNNIEFVPLISELAANNKHKEACQVANTLKLHGHFKFDEFLLPLCVLDKIGVVEEFLTNDKAVLLNFLTYLDDLVEKDTFDKVTDIMKNNNVRDWSASKCGHKPMVKLMKRLLKKHNVPESHCPKLELRRKRSALHYLLAKRFECDGEVVGSESWEEMAMEAIGDSPQLHTELVNAIFDRGEPDEAIQWASLLALPEDQWPPALLLFKHDDSRGPPASPKKSPDHNQAVHSIEYLKLPLPDKNIILVDSQVLFSEFLDRMRNVSVVGLDTEWKPSLFSQNALSLIQVSTHDQVFIIDRLVLAQSMPDVLVPGLLNGLFHNKNIVKLGFDFVGDMKLLKEAFPGLKEIAPLIDLANLRHVLQEKYKFKFPYRCDAKTEPTGKKLKNLIEMCFNKTLDKTEQCSNWERRPLRPSQLEYAALDAYCLLDVYELIKCESTKQGIDLNDISAEAEKPADKKALQFVCTWELALLYKRLRRCGIDTLYNDSRQPSKRIRKLLSRGYIILTSVRQPWLTSDMRSCMVPLIDERSQLRHVLNVFKHNFDVNNTITRCSECNEQDLSELAIETVRALRDNEKFLKETPSRYAPADYGPGPDNYDEDDFDDDGEDYYEPTVAATAAAAPAQGPCRWTGKGKPILFEFVPEALLEAPAFNTFYVCEHCGHVTWPTTLDDMFI